MCWSSASFSSPPKQHQASDVGWEGYWLLAGCDCGSCPRQIDHETCCYYETRHVPGVGNYAQSVAHKEQLACRAPEADSPGKVRAGTVQEALEVPHRVVAGRDCSLEQEVSGCHSRRIRS